MDAARRRCASFCFKLQRLKTAPPTGHAYGTSGRSFHAIFDLINVGLEWPLPVCVYLMAGHVVKDVAGPAAALSAVLAAVTATLAGK